MPRDTSSRGQQMRELIAQQAARLIAEDGIHDFSLAERKAAQQMGAPDTRNLPTNAEIDHALRLFRELFQKGEHEAVLRAFALLESRPGDAVNDFRREQHLIPLQRRADLDAVARAHSEDMARRGFFSHPSPEGDDWVARLRAAGITDFRMAGENVGQTSRSEPNREILEGWKASPVHRENLVSRPMNTTGIGIARAADGRLFYTQLYLNVPR